MKVGAEGLPTLLDDEICTCDHIIPGFSLALKRWGWFELDRLQMSEYNSRAFQSLVLG